MGRTLLLQCLSAISLATEGSMSQQERMMSVLNLTAVEFDDEKFDRERNYGPREVPKDYVYVGYFYHKGKVWAVPKRSFKDFDKKAWSMMMPGLLAFRFMEILWVSGADSVCLERTEAKKLGIDIQKLIEMSSQRHEWEEVERGEPQA
jgi:hypothetical protein